MGQWGCGVVIPALPRQHNGDLANMKTYGFLVSMQSKNHYLAGMGGTVRATSWTNAVKKIILAAKDHGEKLPKKDIIEAPLFPPVTFFEYGNTWGSLRKDFE